jgi:hypothetical protein
MESLLSLLLLLLEQWRLIEGIDVIEAMNGDRTEGSEGEGESGSGSEVENEGDVEDVDDNEGIAGEMCVFRDDEYNVADDEEDAEDEEADEDDTEDEDDEEDDNEASVGEVVLISSDCPCIWIPRTFIAWSYSSLLTSSWPCLWPCVCACVCTSFECIVLTCSD